MTKLNDYIIDFDHEWIDKIDAGTLSTSSYYKSSYFYRIEEGFCSNSLEFSYNYKNHIYEDESLIVIFNLAAKEIKKIGKLFVERNNEF